MGYKPLPKGLARELIKHSSDVITPLARSRTLSISETRCSRCEGVMRQKLHPTYSYTPDDPLPRSVAVCEDCGYTVDPLNGFVLNVGDPAKGIEALKARRGVT